MSRHEQGIQIPMPDGIHLAADLYLPPDGREGDAHPVVVEYIPYRKDDVPVGTRHYQKLPKHGYIVARVDVRGTGASGGVSVDEYTAQEQWDGVHLVEWLAAQDFCDGHVNMMGISYGGFTALQVAVKQPPHLTSIVPMYFTDDRFTDDCHYQGGLKRQYYDLANYGNGMVVSNALPPTWDAAIADDDGIWAERVATSEPHVLNWFRHQLDGDYWRNGSVRGMAHRINCPVLMFGGWADGYPNPPLRLYQELRSPRRLIIGPWNHALPDVAIPGPRIDYLEEVVRWLDYWCKGTPTGVMDDPPIVIYEQEPPPRRADRLESSGSWRAESAWPAPGAGEEIHWLASDGLGSSGTLQPVPPTTTGADSYEYLPDVGTSGGLWSGGLPFGLPRDQRDDECHGVAYSSAPLAADLHVAGRASVTAHVSTDASVVGLIATLTDVAPDGYSCLVAKGALNLARRDELTSPSAIEPGAVEEVTVELDATAWRFRPDHRVRVTFVSADWPNVWPTPEPATVTVHHGAQHPSRVVLPTLPAEPSRVAPRFEPSPPPVVSHVDADKPPTWTVERDLLRDVSRATICQSGSHRIVGGRLDREMKMQAEVSRRNPAIAAATGTQTRRITRGDLTVEVTSEMRVHAGATSFDVSIDLTVLRNGVVTHRRRWRECIDRLLL